MNPTRTLARLALVASLLALHACGDDNDASPTTEAAAPPTTAAATEPPTTDAPADDDLAAYCALATEISEQDGPPTVEQIQAYAEVAPDEIAEPTRVVLAAFEEFDGDLGKVFSDPETGVAIEEMTAFEAEACGVGEPVDEEATTIDPDATRVDVAATDFHFEVEYPTDAGRYSFVMTNDGEEPHLMVLLRLEDGVDFDDVMASDGETGVAAMFESVIASPGGEAVVTAGLAPGHWALVCPIPDDEGTSHIELGMVHEFDLT